MKILIVVVCVAIIIYSFVILIRNIIRMSKGKCCESCKNCPNQHMCQIADPKTEIKSEKADEHGQ